MTAGRKDWSSTDNKALNHSLDSSRHGQQPSLRYYRLVAWDIWQMTTDLHRQINSFKMPKGFYACLRLEGVQNLNLINPFIGNYNTCWVAKQPSHTTTKFREKKCSLLKTNKSPRRKNLADTAIWQDFDFLIVFLFLPLLPTTQISWSPDSPNSLFVRSKTTQMMGHFFRTMLLWWLGKLGEHWTSSTT